MRENQGVISPDFRTFPDPLKEKRKEQALANFPLDRYPGYIPGPVSAPSSFRVRVRINGMGATPRHTRYSNDINIYKKKILLGIFVALA